MRVVHRSRAARVERLSRGVARGYADRVSLEQLRGFVAVAEEAHFGRAARRVGASQPALSRAIQRLEEELGVALLERSSRGVRLAPAGAAFLGHARELLDRVAIARSAALGGATNASPFRVGAVDAGAERALLERGLAPFDGAGLARGERRLELSRGSGARLKERLAAGELDAAVLRSVAGEPVDARFSAERLADDELVAVGAGELGRAEGRGAELVWREGALVEGPVVLVSGAGCSLLEREAARFVAARPGLRIVAVAQEHDTALLLAELGVGAALVPRSVVGLGPRPASRVPRGARVVSAGAGPFELSLLRRRASVA
jgi:DNA-binding transcriptional LysR family regulator